MQPPLRLGLPSGPAEGSLGRLARLQPLTASLSQAVTSSQVTQVILTEAFAALRAGAGIVCALTEDGTEFVSLGVLGYPEEVADGWRRLPAEHPVPIADAVRDRSPVIIPTRQQCAARYPLLSRARVGGADGALAALPLLVRGRPIGALGLSFPTDRDFSEQDRQFMLTLAGLCANALERARLYDAERAARERAEQEVERRRRAEEELDRQRRQFQALAENNPDIVARFDKDFRHRYINRAVESATGLAASQFLGRTNRELGMPADLCERWETDLREVFQTGRERWLEFSFPARGATRHYLARLVPEFGSGGAVETVLGVVRDTTEQKRAEEGLRERVEEVEKLMEVMPVAVMMAHDPACERMTGNRGARDLLGVGAGVNFSKSAPPAERPTHFQPCRQGQALRPEDLPMQYAARHGAEVRNAELDLVFEDGTVKSIIGSASPLRGAGGQVRGCVAAFMDITERKRLEDALRLSEEQFRGAFDSAAIGVAVVAPDGRWLKVNRSLCDIVGYGEQELLALTFQDITHPDDLETALGYVRQMLTGAIPHYHLEKRYLHKRGHVVWVLLSASLVNDAGGRPLYFIAQVQDITARKGAEQERESLIRELRDALATVRTLRGLLPICAWCKNIRNDQGYWKRVEAYLPEHLDVQFTHGMCPACAGQMQEEVKNLRGTLP